MRTVLAATLCALISLGGNGAGPMLGHRAGPAATPVDLVPTVTYQADPAGAQARHSALLAYVAGLKNVMRQPLETAGSTISESVCAPRAPYCTRYVRTGADLGGPGRAITVSAYTYSPGPKGFGNGFELMYVPPTAGHFALSFGYGEDGGGIGATGYYMEFIYLTPALLAAIKDVLPVDYFDNMVSLSLLDGNEFSISDSPEYRTTTGEGIGIPGDARTVIASLDQFMGSARQFRAHAIGREDELLARVKQEVEAGRVTKPVDCHYPGHAAPVCLYGALSSRQKASEIAHAQAAIGAMASLVAHRYQAMYSLLSSQVAWATCPRCWSGP